VPDHISVTPVRKDSISTRKSYRKNLPATHPSGQSAVDLPEYYKDSKDNEICQHRQIVYSKFTPSLQEIYHHVRNNSSKTPGNLYSLEDLLNCRRWRWE
jgi:hypothetical protein